MSISRIEREKKVIGQMIAVYCRRKHATPKGSLCTECSSLLDYARTRLDRCPKGNRKTSCRKCEIHCYAPEKRAKIREVMRFVGPRMIFIHPYTAVCHLLDEFVRRHG